MQAERFCLLTSKGAPTLFLCLALLGRTHARADIEKERARTETWVHTWELIVSHTHTDRDRVKEVLASGVTSKRTRGYALTFGGTDGSMLGRSVWFNAESKGWYDAG